MKAIGVGGAP